MPTIFRNSILFIISHSVKSVNWCVLFLIFYSAVGGDCDNSPRNKFTAFLQGTFYRGLNTAATRHFHTRNGNALYVVVSDNGGQFLGIVGIVKFRASDKGDVIADEIIVEITVGIGGTIRRNQKICAVKIGRVYGHQFYLHGPLGELTARVYGGGVAISTFSVNGF